MIAQALLPSSREKFLSARNQELGPIAWQAGPGNGKRGNTRPVTRLDSVTRSTNGQLQFRSLGETGRFYAIQTSPDSINWTTATLLVNTNGAVEYIDVTSPALAQRFYRVVKQP